MQWQSDIEQFERVKFGGAGIVVTTGRAEITYQYGQNGVVRTERFLDGKSTPTEKYFFYNAWIDLRPFMVQNEGRATCVDTVERKNYRAEMIELTLSIADADGLPPHRFVHAVFLP
jgi:hypothetical protein